ncbi:MULTISPECIES: DUF2316 family protein [Enterococcus]|uniref:DUF2316 family protein n=1 Tax=Enterococcus alishanensis TaxID=1303817 RepID=A0ABS6TEY6_9ENTE|nr:DUF2316 family protein [Enterococcus alishanensis]MBV7391453.1 DUF2316 family protein [Enterococcus alishanensis]
MSLNQTEQQQTIDDLKRNFTLSGLTLEQVANDLMTTPARIENILNLKIESIEEPWILRNYLTEKLAEIGKKAEFTVLVGDYHRLWFLNSQKIDHRLIG